MKKELRAQSSEELNRLLSEKETALRAVQFKLQSGRVKNTKEKRNIKRAIARILTLLNEKNQK
ncbi:50S ribosomal protein L29 [Candidatus Giovannonibacteria bacterium]|nr:50S ribosomal protein L29 [Candidatus Giovannonibacteria bacterium]